METLGLHNMSLLHAEECPHSLGKLIEWKLLLELRMYCLIFRPHSLGKLIEWKPAIRDSLGLLSISPHSLGKLIEWKLSTFRDPPPQEGIVPTRWGN